jgi:hypothetical protein
MTIKRAGGMAAIAAAILPLIIAAQTLDPRLSPLAPLLNKEWRGTMKSVDGSPDLEVVCRFQAVGPGLVVKYGRRSTGREDFEEGYFYWDDIAKTIALFAVHSGGSFRTGSVTAEKGVLTIEGRMARPSPPPNAQVKQAYDFRNTFTFASADEMTDRWFQNAFGPWRPGHEIVFKAAKKSPKRPDSP